MREDLAVLRDRMRESLIDSRIREIYIDSISSSISSRIDSRVVIAKSLVRGIRGVYIEGRVREID
jgi:hypothetical protein